MLLLKETNFSGVHLVQSTHNLDLTAGFHFLQDWAVFSNVVDCLTDILLCDHMDELFILARLFTIIVSEMVDRRLDVGEHGRNIAKFDTVYRTLDGTTVFVAKYKYEL